jgi:hypothetical protein
VWRAIGGATSIHQLRARERQNERQCRRRAAARDSSEQTESCSNKGAKACRRLAERLAWASLAWFSKFEACFLPKSRPQNSSQPGSAGRASDNPLGCDCVFQCKMHRSYLFATSRMQQCHLVTQNRAALPSLRVFVWVDGILRRHVSSESVHRVETGAGPRKGPLAPNIIAVRAISGSGAASQNAIDIEEHAKSSAQYREGWANQWRICSLMAVISGGLR